MPQPSSPPPQPLSSSSKTTTQEPDPDPEPEEQEQCSICLDNPPDHPPWCTIQPCRHRFHYTCIQTWLLTQNASYRGRARFVCPLCRGGVEGVQASNPGRLLGMNEILMLDRDGLRDENVREGSRYGSDGINGEERSPTTRTRPMREAWDGEGAEDASWHDTSDDENHMASDYVMGMDGNMVEWRDRRGERREREYRNRRDHNRRREASRVPAPPSTFGNRSQTNELIAARARIILEEWHRAQERVRRQQQERDNAERMYNTAIAQSFEADYIEQLHSSVRGVEGDLVAAEGFLIEAHHALQRVEERAHAFNVNWMSQGGRGPFPEDYYILEEELGRVREGGGGGGSGLHQGLLEAPRRGGLLEDGRLYGNRRRFPSGTFSGNHARTPTASPPPRRATPERERSRGPSNRHTNNSRVRLRSPSRPRLVSPTQSHSSRNQDIRQQTRDHWSHASFEQERGSTRARPSRGNSNDNEEGPSSSSYRPRGSRDDDGHYSGVPEQWLEEDRMARLNLN